MDRTSRLDQRHHSEREFGKTVGTLNGLIRSALTNPRKDPPPRYAYVGPTIGQVKDVAWGYLKHYTSEMPRLVSEVDMFVDLPNKARAAPSTTSAPKRNLIPGPTPIFPAWFLKAFALLSYTFSVATERWRV